MILKQIGEQYTIGSEVYRVGDRVYANEQSVYDGLYGEILEIRTERNRRNKKEGADIICHFHPPVLPDDIRAVEQRFSAKYRVPKKIDELLLKKVVMAPRMLHVLVEYRQSCPQLRVFRMEEEWTVDGDSGSRKEVYTDYHTAKNELCRILNREMTVGCISNWRSKPDFCEEAAEDSYECGLENDYFENRYQISILPELLTLSPQAMRTVGKLNQDEVFRKDLISEIAQWEEVSSLTEDQYLRFISRAEIPGEIRCALQKNGTYQESYWESLSMVAYLLLHKFFEEESAGSTT